MDEIRLTVQEPEPINLHAEQIATGPYYLPAVSDEGVISWTNNGGLPNPESRSIEGPQGPAGKDGANGQDGAPGTPGTSAYVWIRYAQQQPTQDSDMSTTPGPWMGVCSGASDTAPTDYTAYTWYRIKGDTPTVPVQDVQVNGTSIVTDGVANVPIGKAQFGVVKISGDTYGLIIDSSGVLKISEAGDYAIQNGITSKPITPPSQHKSAFYGLAKAAGDNTQSASSNAVGSYTDSAIDKILAMLGVDALIGTHETSATASEAKAIGDVFIFAGKLYVATDSIAQGAAIVPGTNCTQTNLIELIRGT